MKLNIVKNEKSNEEVVAIVKNTYINSEVTVVKDYGTTIDIEVTDRNGGVYSLETLKELQSDFKDYDIRIW